MPAGTGRGNPNVDPHENPYPLGGYGFLAGPGPGPAKIPGVTRAVHYQQLILLLERVQGLPLAHPKIPHLIQLLVVVGVPR